jgi:hypothetical protein
VTTTAASAAAAAATAAGLDDWIPAIAVENDMQHVIEQNNSSNKRSR